MALHLFQKGLDMGIEADPDVYHQIERQRMLMLSQIGENAQNIKEQTANLAKHPHDFYSHLNLLSAYLYANDNQNALKIFLEAESQFSDQALLYALGGDLYKRLKMYDQAFSCWDKSLKLDSEIAAALWSKATCYEELGNYNAAYQMWEEIIGWLEIRGYDVEVEEPRKRALDCKNKINA